MAPVELVHETDQDTVHVPVTFSCGWSAEVFV